MATRVELIRRQLAAARAAHFQVLDPKRNEPILRARVSGLTKLLRRAEAEEREHGGL